MCERKLLQTLRLDFYLSGFGQNCQRRTNAGDQKVERQKAGAGPNRANNRA
jgi:hypothetical protein